MSEWRRARRNANPLHDVYLDNYKTFHSKHCKIRVKHVRKNNSIFKVFFSYVALDESNIIIVSRV